MHHTIISNRHCKTHYKHHENNRCHIFLQIFPWKYHNIEGWDIWENVKALKFICIFLYVSSIPTCECHTTLLGSFYTGTSC